MATGVLGKILGVFNKNDPSFTKYRSFDEVLFNPRDLRPRNLKVSSKTRSASSPADFYILPFDRERSPRLNLRSTSALASPSVLGLVSTSQLNGKSSTSLCHKMSTPDLFLASRDTLLLDV